MWETFHTPKLRSTLVHEYQSTCPGVFILVELQGPAKPFTIAGSCPVLFMFKVGQLTMLELICAPAGEEGVSAEAPVKAKEGRVMETRRAAAAPVPPAPSKPEERPSDNEVTAPAPTTGRVAQA